MKNKIIFKTLMLKGEAGSTIVSMEKTGHVGTADIYTITFNDGSTTEISLENMSAITSVEKTSSTDTEDIYTITCADGSTQTFSVLNHNADIAAMSDVIDARVDNFINSFVPNTVETLWTGSIKDVGDSATLSKAVSNFDYIDLYLLGSADSKYIRVPATQTAVQIQQQNLSDDASSNFLRLWEMGVSISGSTVSITKSIAWAWDDPNNSNPTVTANAQNSIPITQIDGVKVASDTPAELADIRVGADGTTYNSAGAAVRGQINKLNPIIVNQESVISSENSYDSSMMVYNYWIGQDGVIHNVTGNYGYAKIPVLSGRTYLLSYNNGTNKPSYHSGEAGGYLIYNANDELVENIIVQDLPDATDDVGYPARYITIPDGGAYMLITLALGTTWDAVDIFSLNIINLVGGTLKELYGASVDPYTLKWSNKKWVAFGDSLTEVNTRASLHYHDYIKDATGITVVNMGASGTGYKRSDDQNKAFYQRILNVPTDADVVTIFGSGNDLNYPAMGFNTFAEALGTVTDSTTDTICGCINKTIENLYSVIPTVQLALVTPCPWQGYNPSSVGNSMDLYSQAIVEIARLHGIPCLDLYHCSGLRPWDATFRQLCYSNDDGNGTHPDNRGQKILAPHFNALLESLVI